MFKYTNKLLKMYFLIKNFSSQTEILLLNMLKFLKIPGFLFKVPGFSKLFSKFLKF